jgi:hypothetical protein
MKEAMTLWKEMIVLFMLSSDANVLHFPIQRKKVAKKEFSSITIAIGERRT